MKITIEFEILRDMCLYKARGYPYCSHGERTNDKCGAETCPLVLEGSEK